MKSGSLKERIADALNDLKSHYPTDFKAYVNEINSILDDLSRAEVIERETKDKHG